MYKKLQVGRLGGQSIHLEGGGCAPPPCPDVATCLIEVLRSTDMTSR